MNVDLNSIGGGGLQDRFNREMEKVVKNMKDPNTSYKEMRKIVITLAFKQDEDRNTTVCTCDVQSKLAKTKSFDTNFGIGRDLKTDRYIAKEFIFRAQDDKFAGVQLSLHEADGGRWKLDAMTSIKNYLLEQFAGVEYITITA